MNPDPGSLDRLHDVIAPPPVPWWPPAPGWLWLLALAAFVALIAAVRTFLIWQRNRYRREALAELRRTSAQLEDSNTRPGALTKLAELTKRTALSAYPREQVASLNGKEWLAFLDRTGSTTAFTQGPGERLEHIAYDPRVAANLDESQTRELSAVVHHWIRHHRN